MNIIAFCCALNMIYSIAARIINAKPIQFSVLATEFGSYFYNFNEL